MTHHDFLSPGPVPGVGPWVATRRMFAKTFTYSGRASRSEFWWPTALAVGVTVACDIAGRNYDRAKHPEAYSKIQGRVCPWPFPDRALPGEVETEQQQEERKKHRRRAEATALAFAAPAVILLTPPTTSLAVRRLHDVNMSGHWMWMNAVPLVGSLAGIVIGALPSNPKGARFDA